MRRLDVHRKARVVSVRTRNHNNMKYSNYIVFSHGRTGSTILTRMLRTHSRIVDYQELFNVDFQAEFRRSSNRARSLRYWLDAVDRHKLRTSIPSVDLASVDEAAILDELVWRDGYAPDIRAVGFKLLHYQMKTDGHFPRLRDRLVERLSRVRAVVLTRRNLLRQHLSHVTAHRVGQWHIADASQRRPRPVVQFTTQELVHAFEYVERTEADLSAMAGAAHRRLDFVYEDLIRDFEGCWRQLQRFLDASEEPLPDLRLVKIEHRALREAIANYDELKERFQETRWAVHFDE